MKPRFYHWAFLFVLCTVHGFSQNLDSLNMLTRADSTTTAQLQKVDSIQQSFQQGTREITDEYDKAVKPIDSVQSVLQSKIDSLNSLSLPSNKLTRQLDSLTHLRGGKLDDANDKLSGLRSKTIKGMDEVTLPPQMQGPVDQFKQSVNTYSITDSKSGLPAMDIPGMDIKGLSSLDLPSSGIGDINLSQAGELGKITGAISTYGDDAQQLVKGNLNEVKNVDKLAGEQAMKLGGAGELAEGSTSVQQMHEAGASMSDPEAMQKKAMEEAGKRAMDALRQGPATDYFADKAELVQGVMSKMSNVKSKYGDVKSMFEMPKRPPNPMKEKPFVERMIPFLSMQIQGSEYFLLDVNPGLMYRISGRFSAVAGWNYRLAFEDLTIHKEERIYGPRAGVQFKWAKGVSLRFLPEVMNTYVPSLVNNKSTETVPREWVWSWVVGIKKDFKVYRWIRGNTEMMYNLYDRKDKSPYGDRIHIRFGFEFPMKKKPKKIKDKEGEEGKEVNAGSKS